MHKTSFRLAQDVLVQKVANEMVILNPSDGQYYGLDEIGTQIVQRLLAGDDIQSIIRKLTEEYDVGQDQLERDIQALISKLERHALIEDIG